MSQNTHCHISGLFQIDTITSSSYSLICKASMHGISLNVDDNFISVNLTYYNSLREPFSNGAVVFCSGVLMIVESSEGYPELSVRAHFLVRFVTYYF